MHSAPPGNGVRTLQRVELAKDMLACDTYSVANLYPAILPDSNALSSVTDDTIWEIGKQSIAAEINRSDTEDVLLGFGVQLPTGTQRQNYRRQVDWLAEFLQETGVRVWAFGGRPTHPSRWHRHVHRHAVGSSVEATLPQFLTRYTLAPLTKTKLLAN